MTSSHTGDRAAPMGYMRPPLPGAVVGNTRKKRLKEGFHEGAFSLSRGLTFGNEARTDDRETFGVTLVLPARDIGRIP